jgi:hypothetical protein
MSRFTPVAVSAAVFDRADLAFPFPARSDVESWAAGCSLPARSRKMADTQTLLLFRACSRLIEQNPGLNLGELPCSVAVGPARTDREALLAWSERLVEGEAWPMVSPAAAIGLLPNTPLSWMSIQLGLRGPGSVWSGWSSAGFHALEAGVLSRRPGASPALVAAADAPFNYFVLDSRRRAGLPDLADPVELGAALLISDSGPIEIACLQAYPRGTSRPEIFADLARQTGQSPAALEAACLQPFPADPGSIPAVSPIPTSSDRSATIAGASAEPDRLPETVPPPGPMPHAEHFNVVDSQTSESGKRPQIANAHQSPASSDLLAARGDISPESRVSSETARPSAVLPSTAAPPVAPHATLPVVPPNAWDFSQASAQVDASIIKSSLLPAGVVTGLFVAAVAAFIRRESLPLLVVTAFDADETPRAMVLRRRGA